MLWAVFGHHDIAKGEKPYDKVRKVNEEGQSKMAL
jgi:hypothetical protein